jgi:23S rRNA pseudouridine1911/1915/1917 synthase
LEVQHCWTAGEDDWDERLDRFLASKETGLSRARIQTLIREGKVLVEGRPAKAAQRLKSGDSVSITIPQAVPWRIEAEPVNFEVIYEDSRIIVINKPPGVVVHPGAGHLRGTLVQGVLARCGGLSGIGGIERPGIVHRLDKDTSGVMVMAKDDEAHMSLSSQFRAGLVKKQYMAVVHGLVAEKGGSVNLPIGRNPIRRTEMAVVKEGGRTALTVWKAVRRFELGFSLVSAVIKTGRTHQIRVHLSHIGHPVVGDATYGYGPNREAGLQAWKEGRLPKVSRQLLHSALLGITHRDVYMEFSAPMPEDMKAFLDALEAWEKKGFEEYNP